MPSHDRPPSPLTLQALRVVGAMLLLAVLAACQTTPPVPTGPGNVTRLPPGNAERDGPEARPPPNLEAVPDAVPQVEPIRSGGPNKPYEIAGHTYVPLTDDRALTEKGLASWYGKKFHGHRTASGEAYNMYAMTAAHKTLPIPSYARVRNPANGKEVIVRVNDRGPFAAGRVIDLSYTAALKLGVLNGVTTVEISRITAEDIRTGAALRKPAPAEAPTAVATGPGPAAKAVPDAGGDVIAAAVELPPRATDARPLPAPPSSSGPAGVDLGAAAATDNTPATPGTVTTTTESVSTVVTASAGPERPDERTRAETTASVGWWIQLGAFKQRDGALAFQARLVDEQPWLAPLLAVFTERGLNKLQAGPYPSRNEARSAAQHIRGALQLVPTIVDKH
jgi:rare lipoprotein A